MASKFWSVVWILTSQLYVADFTPTTKWITRPGSGFQYADVTIICKEELGQDLASTYDVALKCCPRISAAIVSLVNADVLIFIKTEFLGSNQSLEIFTGLIKQKYHTEWSWEHSDSRDVSWENGNNVVLEAKSEREDKCVYADAVNHWHIIRCKKTERLSIRRVICQKPPADASLLTCLDQPCRNFGTCVKLDSSGSPPYYKCICPTGKAGTTCEADAPAAPCQGDPCCSNGRCVELGGGQYKCECIPSRTGVHCESEIDACATSPCQFNATCMGTLYRCECPAGNTGLHCETNLPSSAAADCDDPPECTHTALVVFLVISVIIAIIESLILLMCIAWRKSRIL